MLLLLVFVDDLVAHAALRGVAVALDGVRDGLDTLDELLAVGADHVLGNVCLHRLSPNAAASPLSVYTVSKALLNLLSTVAVCGRSSITGPDVDIKSLIFSKSTCEDV